MKKTCLIFIIIQLPIFALAHGPIQWLYGSTISPMVFYETKQENFGYGANIGATFILLNTGYEFRNINNNVNHEGFFGIGLGPFFQVQYGTKNSLRLRLEIYSSLTDDQQDLFSPFRNGIAFTYVAHRFLNSKKQSWIHGIGIGISF